MSDDDKELHQEPEMEIEHTEEPEAILEQEEHTEEHDPIVEKAKATGHLSPEEYKAKHGSLDGYKTEKEFALTGELIDLKKTIQKREDDIEKILKYHQSVVEQQKANFKAQLEARLQEARELGDIPAIEKYTAEKIELHNSELMEKAKEQAMSQQQAASWFMSRNSTWYNDAHPELKQRCAEVEADLIQRRIYHSYSDLAQALEDRMRSEIAINPDYNHLLHTGGAARPTIKQSSSRVAESVAKSTPSSDTALYAKLPAEEKAMYNALARMAKKSGASYSVKEFMDQQRRDKEI